MMGEQISVNKNRYWRTRVLPHVYANAHTPLIEAVNQEKKTLRKHSIPNT